MTNASESARIIYMFKIPGKSPDCIRYQAYCAGAKRIIAVFVVFGNTYCIALF